MQRGLVVFVDTTIIIEAFRAGCWKAMASYFSVETVEKCYEEALTGDPLRASHVDVDPTTLRDGLRARHSVSAAERARLVLACPSADGLDPGERDLFAHARGRSNAWLVSAADRAAVNVALALNWEERIVSLEALTREAGARPTLRPHFSDTWLSRLRTTYKLDRM
jgi:hypothetical protein